MLSLVELAGPRVAKIFVALLFCIGSSAASESTALGEVDSRWHDCSLSRRKSADRRDNRQQDYYVL